MNNKDSIAKRAQSNGNGPQEMVWRMLRAESIPRKVISSSDTFHQQKSTNATG